MGDHDSAYRRLFSHQEMVRDLLTGFVHQPWVEQLDMDTLEKVNSDYISDDLRARTGDAVWRVRWRPSGAFVYLMLEFQSTVDRFMAVRIMAYIALLYQDLISSGQCARGAPLPPVLPIVLYNGKPRWRAPTGVRPLVHYSPEELRAYLSEQCYLLLDEGAYTEHELAQEKNLVAALFRLELVRTPEHLQQVLAVWVDWLTLPEQAGLHRNLIKWLWRWLELHHLSGADLSQIQHLQEVNNMLSERVQEWKQDFMKQGLAQGLEQGLEQGLAQGLEQGLEKGRTEGLERGLKRGRTEEARVILLRQLTRRFGPLPTEVKQRLEQADIDLLETWADRVLDASALAEVFE